MTGVLLPELRMVSLQGQLWQAGIVGIAEAGAYQSWPLGLALKSELPGHLLPSCTHLTELLRLVCWPVQWGLISHHVLERTVVHSEGRSMLYHSHHTRQLFDLALNTLCRTCTSISTLLCHRVALMADSRS